MLKAVKTMIHPIPERIIYAYGEWQDIFEEMKGEIENIEFVRGITESLVSRENLGGQRTLLVIDDLADEISPALIGAIFVKLSHHRHISTCFMVNNLFYRGLPNYRLIAVNTQYYIVFRNSRDQSSITTLARQMFGSHYKYMVQAYEDSVKRDFGYLFIDLKSGSKKELRLRTNILPHQDTICYVIKDG